MIRVFFYIQIIAALTFLTKLLELLFHIKVSNYVHEGTSRIASHMLNEIVKSISSTASMIYEHYKSVLRFCLHSLSFSVATHLVNQHYKACIRRGNAKEVICYIACTHIVGATGTTAGGAATGQVFTVYQSYRLMNIEFVTKAYNVSSLNISFILIFSQVLDSGKLKIFLFF